MRKINFIKRFILVGVCLVITVGGISGFGQARSTSPAKSTIATNALQAENGWSQPYNLSKSGAADQPRILASQDGAQMQIFWVDKFDGLLTSLYDGKEWSASIPSPINVPFRFRAAGGILHIPYFSIDPIGRIHAYWYGKKGGDGTKGPLIHNQLKLGYTNWSPSQLISDSVLSFTLSHAASQETTLAYINYEQTDLAPAGLYARRTAGDGAIWYNPVPVWLSVYYRVLQPDNARISIANTGAMTANEREVVYLAWDDPHQPQSYFSVSSDDGATWSEPTLFASSGERTANPRLFKLGAEGNMARIWQALDFGDCALFQQRYMPIPDAGIEGYQNPAWDSPQPVLDDLETCPTGAPGSEIFLQTPDGQRTFWVWGQGSPELFLTSLDPHLGTWDQPEIMSFNFEDQETRQVVLLSDLHAALFDNQLVVVGADPDTGEVWVTKGKPRAMAAQSAPGEGSPGVEAPQPSNWSSPQEISQNPSLASDPETTGPTAIVMDEGGNVRMVWAGALPNGQPTLFYAQRTGDIAGSSGADSTSRASDIFPGKPGEIARHPALLVENLLTPNQGETLHLVWSGGANGEIRYSRAKVAQASQSGDWLPFLVLTQNLAPGSAGAWPQLGIDAGGRLYTAYNVPANEGRGVYLVYSDDSGDTWSDPTQVFDAATAGWQMADQSTLAVTPGGAVHIAWVQKSLTGERQPLSIHYARSTDRGQTWSKPFALVQAGFEWPKLLLQNGQLHLLLAKNEDQSAWHRWVDASEHATSSTGWSTASRVPGWFFISLPFGAAVSGRPDRVEGETGALHLAGINVEERALYISAWNGERWSNPETSPLGGPVSGFGSDTVPPFESSLSAATRLQGGALAATWPGHAILETEEEGETKETIPALFYARRVIPTVDAPPINLKPITPPVQETPTPEVDPTPVPSPTPELEPGPAQQSLPIPPMALGGGLAALIVVIIFTGILRSRGRHGG